MHKKVYVFLVLVFALVLGAWTGLPARTAAAQSSQAENSACDHASTELVGRFAELPRIRGLIHDICDYRVRLNGIDSNASELDRHFVEYMIAGNTLEIQSLQFALEHATNEEWRGLIRMMITMHTADLEMALAVAEKIGADTDPDLTNVRVFPETPDYDLGIRRVNLVAKYLDPLMNSVGVIPGTPTTVPTDMGTGTATGVPTDIGTATGLPTDMATGTATGLPTDVPTGTATALPTDVSTATAMPTDMTGTATGLPTDIGTATGLPTDMATGTATVVPTSTPVGPGPGVNFDAFSLDIIMDQHVMGVQQHLVAQRLVENDELRAFAKHASDVAELHILLMSDLQYRLVYNWTPPLPPIREDYQSPRRFQPR